MWKMSLWIMLGVVTIIGGALVYGSIKATLKDGDITVTLLFRFNPNGLIDSVRAEARGRTIAGTVVPTPWEGHWSNYEHRDGMRTPIEGEVAWMLPEGPKPYWRGWITKLSYEACTMTDHIVAARLRGSKL